MRQRQLLLEKSRGAPAPDAKTLSCRRNSLTSAFVTGEYAWLWWLAAAVAALLALGLLWAWQKGRPFTTGDVFRASRWSRGNHLLPTQVAIRPTAVVQYTPQWIGKQEETIHMAHIASVRI